MISNKLKEFRKTNKLTQQQIADALNIERSTYAYYENGKNRPNINILSKLSRIYNVTLDALTGNDVDALSFYDDTEIYNSEDGTGTDRLLSGIKKDEREFLVLFRAVNDKDAVLEFLRKMSVEKDM